MTTAIAKHRVVLLLAMLAWACLPALAATPIDEARPLDARGTVEVENLKGRIEIRTWDRPEVRVTGSLGKGVERLRVEGDAARVKVKVEYPRNNRSSEPTTLVLHVPRLADLDIESVSADVAVDGAAGRTLAIESVSGRVQAVGAPGQTRVETVSGDQRLTLNSADVKVETVSGRIDLSGRLDGTVSAESVSGDVQVDTRGERARRIDGSTVSGNASIRSALADGGKLSVESVSGNVRVLLPANVSAVVRGETFSGRLRAPGARINRAKYGPGADFEHRYGEGKAEVRMETFSGNADVVLE